jgi:chromatin structure-remodeling complex subunit RSC1/2
MNVSRVPPAKHSLTYLHFLATKRKQGEQRDGGRGEGEQAMDEDDNDNDGGGEDELSRSDMGVNKRVKLDNGVRPTTREVMQKLWVEMGMEW